MLIHLHRHVSALSKQLFPIPSGVWGGQPTRAAALWSHPPPSPPLTHTISADFINRNQTCILERIIIIIQAHTPSHAHPGVLFYLIISRFASLDDLNQFFFSTSTLFLHLREVGEGGERVALRSSFVDLWRVRMPPRSQAAMQSEVAMWRRCSCW